VLVLAAVLAVDMPTSLGRRTAVIVRRPVNVRGVVRAMRVNQRKRLADQRRREQRQ